MESISNVFIGNTGVFSVSKSYSEPKERFAPAKTTGKLNYIEGIAWPKRQEKTWNIA